MKFGLIFRFFLYYHSAAICQTLCSDFFLEGATKKLLLPLVKSKDFKMFAAIVKSILLICDIQYFTD